MRLWIRGDWNVGIDLSLYRLMNKIKRINAKTQVKPKRKGINQWTIIAEVDSDSFSFWSERDRIPANNQRKMNQGERVNANALGKIRFSKIDKIRIPKK